MYKRQLATAILGLSAFGVWGQDTAKNDSTQVEKLDEVVVTDSRFALSRENSGKTVVRISGKTLERQQGRSVAEILNTASGLEVNGSRSHGGQNISVYARGGNNRQVLVLIDGVQVSDPSALDNAYDLRLLDAGQVERIEILKGAASTLYGNSAATAVINIVTKKAVTKGLHLEVASTLGTNQPREQDGNISQIKNNFQLSMASDKVRLNLLGGHQFTDGLSAVKGVEEDVFSRYNGQINLDYEVTKRFSIAGKVFYTKMKSDYDNGFPLEDADFSFTGEESRFALSSAYTYNQGKLQVNTAFNQIDRGFVSNFPSSFHSQSFTLDAFNSYIFNKKWHTVLGFNGITSQTVFMENENVSTWDPYVNVVYVGPTGFNLNTGARLNNHSTYGTHFIYNVNPSYRFPIKKGYAKVFGSYATSFIAPSLSQLYGPFGANPALGPETNATFESGLEYRPSQKIRFSALFFQRKEEGRILFTVIDPENFTSQYQNSSGSLTFKGAELELEANPLKHMALSANYTFTDGQEGLAIRVPKHRANIMGNYQFTRKTDLNLTYQYVSERQDTDFTTMAKETLSAYGLLGAQLNHQCTHKLHFFLGVDNVLNTYYEEILGYTTRGRNYSMGFRLRL